MRWIVRLAAIAIVLGVALQFVRPALKNPPVTAEIQAPPEVKAVLKKSCYSCHSNETKLPWFDQIVPAYWLVRHDVTTARRHLNFSEIGSMPAAAQKAELYEAVNQIQLGAMPLPRFLKVHPDAVVSAQDLAVLRAYLNPFGTAAIPKLELTEEADKQFAGWVNAPATNVKPSPNGLTFFPDYKNWKEISTTDRGDNGTMRVITANDIAVKAIASHQINPWPDGAAFAKIAWKETPDDKSVIHAGAFLQVEFMVKDKQKYASSAGWGWGRWRGMDLKPYGKDEHLANECVGCHAPVRDNDFVYTQPIERNGTQPIERSAR